MNYMTIEIWSDIMCPFCYIGKRKFETALNQVPFKDEIQVIWKSFQLDPELVTDPSITIHDYLAERKGFPEEQARQMNQRVTEMAAEVGLLFHLDRAVVANSLNAHRLIQLAKKWGRQAELEEALFQAYFTDSINIDSANELLKIGTASGLPENEIKIVLESDLYVNEVLQDQYEAQNIRVRGVPHFVFNDKYVVSGAQDSSVFLGAITQSYQEWEKQNTIKQQSWSSTDNNQCDIEGHCD